MSCCAGPIVVDLAQETSLAHDRQRLSELESSAKHLQDGSVLYTLSVPSIHCGQCISTIEKKTICRSGLRFNHRRRLRCYLGRIVLHILLVAILCCEGTYFL